MVRTRLKNGRREELLAGVMGIIAARGFSELRTAEIAHELHCSVSTLYKIAPSKDSLLVLAIRTWAEGGFAEMEARAQRGKTASERARIYFRAGAERTRSLSLEFYADVERYESAGLAWWTYAVDPYIKRFIELVQLAEDAGEIRPLNIRFLAELVRGISAVTRSERVLAVSGLTHEEAVLEVDALLWAGMQLPADAVPEGVAALSETRLD